MNLVFMGTPDFAVPTLAALLDTGHRISAVYTQPPRNAGRGKRERRSPVHVFSVERGLTVITPGSFKAEDVQNEFAEYAGDAAIVVAYGQILPQPVLDAPRYGCFNLHASLLPRWRGAAPVQRAIMAGDAETAACVMRMEAGLDTGPVCAMRKVAIDPGTTAGMLHDELASSGAALMVDALQKLRRGGLECHAQASTGVTYAAKIDKAETQIDFSKPAAEVVNHVHGLSPWPGAWFGLPEAGKPVRVKLLRCEAVTGAGTPGEVLDDQLTIACGKGAVRATQVQREGKAPMTTDALLRGYPIAPRTIIGRI